MEGTWWWILLALSVFGKGCESRTLDAGRSDAELFSHPIHGISLPIVSSDHETGFMIGLNDLQPGLMDKGNAAAHRPEAATPTTPPPPPPPAPEYNNIFPMEERETVERALGESDVIPDEPVPPEPAEPEDEFDEDIFSTEQDTTVIMRRMYDSLTKRLNMLRSRVTSVEQTARDVLARLTVLDCADLQAQGKPSGVYKFHMDHNGKRPVTVVCDMDTDGGGWTVIQRRQPHSRTVDFNRGWHDYKMGFGNASSDYWIGLENIYIWTNTRHYELRIELTDFDGDSAYALYDKFYIDNESRGYRLHVSGYSGTAGDSMTNEDQADNYTADGMMFTTHDVDHDTSHEINCAKYWKIGGWWFNRCSWANLNGPYKEPGDGDGIGINWHMWRNKEYLRSSAIMIRPARNP
ncbi:hypothetical protein Pcinc_030941 [Petrolisthes cinctipes]|uniref:Fibrinogen C-terminal domain-containing protein n=1 Tax=Petrolisthes cinctipes TaxID=88211 RepID=A0AAE1EXN5_PETCI|nr:hypothetical protein Pcinc_030941 [Petrolisthes cinctipes]